MSRLLLALATAALAIGCSGAMGVVPLGERSSTAAIEFSEQATEAAGRLLAYDPARHSLDIEVALPIEQADDIDVFIIPSSGIRFQILSSFQDCRVEGAWRICSRQLPMLPEEDVDDWRVEAERGFANGVSPVEVDVTWVPVGSS